MRLRILGLLPCVLTGALSGCHSLDDYAYPAPQIDTAPAALRMVGDGAVLSYDAAFDPLPVVAVSIDGRATRALVATRRNHNSIAPDAVLEGTVVEGEATVPHWTLDGVEPVVRQVVRLARLELGGVELDGLLAVVEPLPSGIDLALTPAAFPGATVTLDGPARELRLRPGRLPDPEDEGSETVRLEHGFLMGSSAAKSSRFMASIIVVAASELDGPLMVGPSTSTVIETRLGPELLPAGPGALEPHVSGEREVRMDDVFGRDHDRAMALEIDALGSGWLVLGAQYLALRVLELDPDHRLARLR